MTPDEEFSNGISVGKMYASTPIWWQGFIFGNMLGTWMKCWASMFESDVV